MSPAAPTITDHHGRTVPVLEIPYRRFGFALPHPDLPHEEFARIRRVLMTRGREFSGQIVVYWLIAALFLGGAVLGAVGRVRSLPVPFFAFVALAAAASAIQHRWWVPKTSPLILRDLLLAGGRCPSCAYHLHDVTPQSDGARVCPECAAAWILDPAHRPPEPPGRWFRLGRALRRRQRHPGP